MLASSFFWLILEGVKVGLFTPGEAFEVVARRRIQKLKEPATKIVSLVSEEIKIVFHSGLAKVGRGKGLSRTLYGFIFPLSLPEF